MVDFRKGLNITELDEERSEKAEYIRKKMVEATNNRKTSKSQAGRVAIDGCYKLLKMMEEEKEDKNRELRKILDFEDKLLSQEL